jgi:hypothetical protein
MIIKIMVTKETHLDIIKHLKSLSEHKGVIELLWDVGGTTHLPATKY